jgi:hypothetical protein
MPYLNGFEFRKVTSELSGEIPFSNAFDTTIA